MLGLLCLLLLAPSAALGAAGPDGDKEYGAYLASQCVSCHREDGVATDGVPAIVGWPSGHFITVMEAYRSKARDNEVMRLIAAALTDEEIAALAAYFAGLPAQASR